MTHNDRLPFLAEAETPLSDLELDVLRTQYASEGKDVTVQTKFNLAWGLIKARHRENVIEGIQLFQDISSEFPDRRRECQYYLALGNYKLGNYTEARLMNGYLLESEPKNIQAVALKNMIEKKVSRDGIMGLIMVGTAITGLAVAASYFFRKKD